MSNYMYGAEPNPGQIAQPLATFSAKEIYNLVEKSYMEFKQQCKPDAFVFYVKKSIPNHMGTVKRYSQKDYSTYARYKAELGLTKQAQFAIGFHKDVHMRTIALEQQLSEEAIKFDRWDDVRLISKMLGQTVPNRINLDDSHFAVTFAQGTSYVDMDGEIIDTTTGDGLSIANSAHLLAHSPKTYTNIAPASLFNKTAFQVVLRIARNNTMDNFGIPKKYNWSHIWATNDPENSESILQFLKSRTDNTQGNANVDNVYYSYLKPVFLEEIDTDIYGERDESKSNWWGIGAFEGDMLSGDRASFVYAEWEAPYLKPFLGEGSNAVDFSRDALKYGARGRNGRAVLDGMGIIYVFAPNN